MATKPILRDNEFLFQHHTVKYCQDYIKQWNKSIGYWLRIAHKHKRAKTPNPYASNLTNAIRRRNEFKRLLAAREAQNDLDQIVY